MSYSGIAKPTDADMIVTSDLVDRVYIYASRIV